VVVEPDSIRPEISLSNRDVVIEKHPELGSYNLYADGNPDVLFCDNETNVRRLHGQNDAAGHFKDAFHDYVVHGDVSATNP